MTESQEPTNGLIVVPPGESGELIVRPSTALIDPRTGLPILDAEFRDVVDPRAATTIVRTPMIDDDGTGEYGTVINNDWKQEFYNQIDAALAATAGGVTEQIDISTAGTHNPVFTGSSRVKILRCYPGSGDITVQSVGGGSRGDLLVITNTVTTEPGQGKVLLPDYNAGVGTQKRFINRASSAPTPLGPYGAAIFCFDVLADKWNQLSHEQGSWIRAPFNAANFSASGGMTWAVTSGEIAAADYRLVGRTINLIVNMTGQVGGSVSQNLWMNALVWGGFAMRSNFLVPCQLYVNGVGQAVGNVSIVSASTLGWGRLGALNHAAGLVAVYGSLTFEVS